MFSRDQETMSFDLRAKLSQLRKVAPMSSEKVDLPKNDPPDVDLVICTDGACTRNGKDGALAGVGVYFGDGDPRNISEALEGDAQTNNRAEMTAFIYALDYAVQHPDLKVLIQSDSSYCVNGFASWVSNWVKSKWVTSQGKPVKNRDLWERIVELQTQLKDRCVQPQISWVRGHNGHAGNEAADFLATEGVKQHPNYVDVPKPVKRKRKSKPQVSKKKLALNKE